MEDIGDQAFEAFVEEGNKYLEVQADLQKSANQPKKEETSKFEKHLLFLQFPPAAAFHIVQNHKIMCPKKKKFVENKAFREGTLAQLPADLKIPAEVCTGLDRAWVVDKVVGGWNSGHVARSPLEVNRLAAFTNQVEFVPVKTEKGQFAVLHKCRYDSVNYLPGAAHCPFINNLFMFTDGGIIARPIPDQLVKAFGVHKVTWPVMVGFTNMLQKVCPTMPNVSSIAYALGAANLKRIENLVVKLPPKAAYDVIPTDERNGVFASNTTAWSKFFGGFAYDEFGPISVARALVGLGFTKIYGQVNDFPVWAHEPCILKVPNQVESIIKHQFVPFRSLEKWTKGCLVYIATPEELKLAVRNTDVTALAMPVTAVLASAPQVGVFSSRHEKVKVSVYMSDPPCCIFEVDNEGLYGVGLSDQLKLLEKAIIQGFIEVLVDRAKGNNCYGFRILPAKDYSITKCYVSIEKIDIQPAFASHRYMSMTNAELRKFVPTERVSDVRVGGEFVFKDAGDSGTIPLYPRCSPRIYMNCNLFLNLGDYFNFENGDYKGNEKMKFDSWADRLPATYVDPEGEQVFVDKTVPKKPEEEVPKPKEAPKAPEADKAGPEPRAPPRKKAKKDEEPEEVVYVPPAEGDLPEPVYVPREVPNPLADMMDETAMPGEDMEEEVEEDDEITYEETD